jgi:hypothetical protein
MYTWLLILFALSGCASNPIIKTEYVSKPPLAIAEPVKPVLSEPTWKVVNGNVQTSKPEFSDFLIDLSNISNYIQKLQGVIDAYKGYYESPSPKDKETR